jgi:hypothetical protein
MRHLLVSDAVCKNLVVEIWWCKCGALNKNKNPQGSVNQFLADFKK